MYISIRKSFKNDELKLIFCAMDMKKILVFV